MRKLALPALPELLLTLLTLWIPTLIPTTATRLHAEEGMFPISEIQRLNLQQHGLQLNASEVFRPDGTCLVDGICRVNGCTGSFVSSSGLIITNHHCAFRAIQTLSTPERDYLRDGFQAQTIAEERHAPGYTVRITESWRDVSADVLSVVQEGMSFVDRTKALDKRRKELEQAAEREHPAMRAEVAEMFAGKSYVLFLYTWLKDVRLVFAPPASVGAFGGEVDNWEWPRHTGDFAFMRAWTAPDGSSADYAPENIPYRPKRVIAVEPRGVNEEDFVMLLGYPSRTVRHKTARFLEYEQNIRLPFVVETHGWEIRTLESAGRGDRAIALKHASRIKSLANVEKRSRGQLQGLRRAPIIARKRADEQALQTWVDADPDRQRRSGSLLKDIATVYAEQTASAPYELNLLLLRSACQSLSVAWTLVDASHERRKADLEREAPYMDRNFDQTRQQLLLTQQDLHLPTDSEILRGLLRRLTAIPEAGSLTPLQPLLAGNSAADSQIEALFSTTRLTSAEFVEGCLQKTPEQLAEINDGVLNLMLALYPEYLRLRDIDKRREGELGQLYGQLVEIKQEFQKSAFVPDANATLRLTFGHVRGYSPQDAVYKSPITTLRGLIDKTTGEEPFITPQRIRDMYEAGQFGQFAHPTLNQVPVAILYNTDTTGGNSGSPILNSQGRLVGVNFDRTFEATINDFAWDPDLSRSLGVDIRFVLWITGPVSGATRLLQEMGVPTGDAAEPVRP